jgi:hypothetical protein
MRLFAFVLAAAAGLATGALAQSHLVLEGFADADHRAALQQVFHAAFEPGIAARVVVEPKSGTEYAVALKQSNGQYSIVSLMASTRVDEAAAKHAKSVVLGCNVDIPPRLGMHLQLLWQQMLLRTGPARQFKTVGDNYRFSASLNGQEYAGQIWSPDASSAPGQFVEIVHTMRDFCASKDPALQHQLHRQAAQLYHQLVPPSQI